MLVHSVYFWLKDGVSQDERSFFRAQLESLKDVSSAQAVHVGTAAATQREVVDSSYDFALTLIFEDLSAHDKYQVDPAHKAFLENCSSMFDRILIYDAD